MFDFTFYVYDLTLAQIKCLLGSKPSILNIKIEEDCIKYKEKRTYKIQISSATGMSYHDLIQAENYLDKLEDLKKNIKTI